MIANWDAVVRNISHSAPKTAAFAKALEGNRKYRKQYAAYRAALLSYRDELEMQTSQTPYGVPYKPDIFSPEPVINAMNFVLGGGSSHYMFLILASRKLLQQRNN